MSGKLSERKIARLLAEREEHEPPEGLLERIRAEIPPLEALDLSPLRDGRSRRGRLLHRLPTTWLAAASIVFVCIGSFVVWQLTPRSSSLPEEVGPGETAPATANVPAPPPPPMLSPRGAEPVTATAESLLERHRHQEPLSEADAKAKAPSGRANVDGNEERTPRQYLRPVPPPQKPGIPGGVVGGAPAPAVPPPPAPPKPQRGAGGAVRSEEVEALPEIAPAEKPSPQPPTLFDTAHARPAQASREAFPSSPAGARRAPQCEGGLAPWTRDANRFVLRIAAPAPASPPSGLAAAAPAARDELGQSQADRRAAAEYRLEKKEVEREGSLDAGPSVRFDPQSVVRVRRLGERQWRNAGRWEAVAPAAGAEPLALFEIEVRPGVGSERLVAQVRTGGAVVRELRLSDLKQPFAATSSELQLSLIDASLADVKAGTLHLSPDELRALVEAARRAADRWPGDARSRQLRLRVESAPPPP